MSAAVRPPALALGGPRERAAVALAAGLLAIAAWAVVGDPKVVVAALAGVPAAYVAFRLDKAVLVSVTVASYIFLGHSRDMALPVDPVRGLLVVVVVRYALDAWRARSVDLGASPGQLWWLWTALAAAVASLLAAGEVTNRQGLFYLLDQYGVVPFLFFCLGPWAFDSRVRREWFLLSLLGTGLYLGITGTLEGLGLGSLTFPRYIDDPSVGIHYGRARGPFASAVPMGAAVSIGILAAILVAQVWKDARMRALAAATGLLCLFALICTLTRGSWVGVVPAVMIAIGMVPRTRRLLPIAIVGGATVVALALTFSPGLREKVSERGDAKGSVWERENTNRAALRVIADHPFAGVGLRRYTERGKDYLRQSPDFPLYGAGVVVHNQFLLLAAELGLIGFTIWLLAYAACIVVPSMRRGPPELRPWQATTLGALTVTAVNGLFTPPVFPYANFVTWTLAGLVWAWLRSAESERARDEEPGPAAPVRPSRALDAA